MPTLAVIPVGSDVVVGYPLHIMPDEGVRMQFIVRVVANALAIWVAAAVVAGFTVDLGPGGIEDPGTWTALAVIALVFTVVNSWVRPLVELLAFPVVLLTLGLFLLVVNAGMVLLTAEISTRLGAGLHVDGFWSAVLASVVIGLVNWILGIVLPLRR